MTDQQEKKDELKEYHIFISYRVASEAILAEKICDKVQQHFVGVDGRCRFVVVGGVCVVIETISPFSFSFFFLLFFFLGSDVFWTNNR